MDVILRLSGAVERDPAIDVWLNSPPDDLRSIARKWFTQMRQLDDDVRELMHDGCPVACVFDAPFAYVNTFRSHVNVGFFNGAALRASGKKGVRPLASGGLTPFFPDALSDPAGLLEGAGKRMRHVKLKPGFDIDFSSLTALIDESYRDMKMRVQLE
jgi:hypothetical protein